MKELQEAYKLLDVSEDISDKELKAIYRTKAKLYHPDVYKADPTKLTKINSAYQLICDYREHPEKYAPQPSFGGRGIDFGGFNIQDFLGGMVNEGSQTRRDSHIDIPMKITFGESILGCDKEISYKRNAKCQPCNGKGFIKHKNACTKCDGYGIATHVQNGMVFQANCQECKGKNAKRETCTKCKGSRIQQDSKQGTIAIPGGVSSDTILSLRGHGNFLGTQFNQELYTDVQLHIEVVPDKQMKLVGRDVHSTLSISLLEALEGVNKQIETVHGTKDIAIQSKAKHMDQIKIAECGVKGTGGSHIVNIEIVYPDDVSSLVGELKKCSSLIAITKVV